LKPEKRKEVLSIIEKYPLVFHQSKDFFFISSENLKEIKRNDLRLLREKDLSRLKFLCLIFFSILILSFFLQLCPDIPASIQRPEDNV